MPTVYLPLGSAEAYGQMGQMIVYQGTIVRKYVVPRDPRTDAQLDVRKLFSDITKMIRAAGPWPRASFRTIFGSRWFTSLYQLTRTAMFEVNPDWEMSGDDFWNSFTEPQQEAWNAAVPYQATWNEPGRIFWNCYFAISTLMGEKFEYPLFEGEYVDPVTTWWLRDLSDAALPSMYDDDEGGFTYFGTWQTQTNAQAYGGSYQESAVSAPQSFYGYFYGRKAEFTWKVGPQGGSFDLWVDYNYEGVVSQYNESELWQQVVSTELLIRGLHFVRLQRVSSNVVNLDAITIE